MNPLLLQCIILLAAQNSGDLDDPELLLRIKNGDHEAFKIFFEQYHSYLIHFLLKKGCAKDAAQDLVQQAFVMIWEKRADIDENKSLRSYLFRIAYTRMLNLYRDNARFDRDTEPEISSEDHSEDSEDRSSLLNAAIESSISEMPEKRQEVFRLCFLQEFTYREAAEVLNVSIKTVENHMGLALKDLRSALEKFR